MTPAGSSKEFPTTSSELQATLQRIVDDVVAGLGCVGAMAAPLEMDNTLPVRAYSVSIAPGLLKQLEDRLGLTFISPRSVAYINDRKFKDNLSVRAVKGTNGRPEVVTSNRLYDLFRPVISKPLSDMAQQLTGIKQVIAVPFFIGDDVIGNLIAASREEFSERDIDFLTAFGHQAATTIRTQRYLTEMQALERVILSLQASITDETQVLQIIVDTVVQKLGYIGAMVSTLEAGNMLPVRAYAIGFDSSILNHLEEKLGVTLIGPKAVAYLDDDRFQENLSVRAMKGIGGRPHRCVVSDRLYDLFRPVISRPLSDLAQQLTGIKQVMAVPFFLEDEVVGNLFVTSQKPEFSDREQEVLATFSQQAAVGIRNARLYRKAEERRQIAQMFGTMAFSAAAYIHTLRNHVGASLTFLQLLELGDQLSPEQRLALLKLAPDTQAHLTEAIGILDNLHKPWHQSPDVPTNVNDCLILSVQKVFLRASLDMNQSEIDTGEGVMIYKSLAENLPLIRTSPDMLTEAFRVVVKNAVEAMLQETGNTLWFESRLVGSVIQVSIRDDGIGIKPVDLNRIFEMGWSTKKSEGMGFGLFWTKDYIEGFGGSIRIESAWGEGTTFCFNLPAPVDQNA
jgi:signal transduction histidine kinase